ncbi:MULTISPECIES: hypothetical protein [Xanthomonas]|uniref:Lipoprotein n=1 Tax=Xanthomonas cannabis pv. phaseoli TaxID=1885902 RepID=A0AB34PC33_9XANT|nr:MULTISPECIES: hypothetical protein [Xanthomonas]KGK59212.1 hypothetical protein NC00_03535 [Xanthomonas cannabis pv. phaseoli]PPU37818.1 hypothetical protein XspCFBP7912_01750 [Xanthomonas sp. CFBP 7912]
MKMKQIHRSMLILLAAIAITGCSKADEVTKAGDVNLAGCDVPVGTKRADAEAIQCDSASTVVPVKQKTAPSQEAVTVTPDAEVIDAAIVQEAKTAAGASEYKDARKVVEGDLNGDGTSEVVALYTLEGQAGSNGAGSYLAAFQRNEAGQLQLAGMTSVSGFGVAAQKVSLKKGAVHVTLLVPGPDDPDCCPSMEEESLYVFHGGKWLQVQPSP